MPNSTKRVGWNWSSTASLKGKRQELYKIGHSHSDNDNDENDDYQKKKRVVEWEGAKGGGGDGSDKGSSR